MQSRVANRLNDPGFVYYAATEHLHWLNVGQRLFALITLFYQKTANFSLTNTQAFYTISSQISDYLRPLRVNFGTTRLIPATLHQLDLENDTWRATPGNPLKYAQAGFDLLAVYPQTAAGVNSLALTYAAEPPALVNPTDVPVVPGEHIIDLEDFDYWGCRIKEGGTELQNAMQFMQRFLTNAQKYRSFVMSKSRGPLYDQIPFDLTSFDRGRLEFRLGKAPQGKVKMPREPKPKQPKEQMGA